MTGSVGSASPEELFGQGVRAARQARGWSQEGLASQLASKIRLNVGGQSGVARIERGERPTRLNEVVAIADFLGLDLEIDLGSYGRAARKAQANELNAAVLDVEAQLTEMVATHQIARERADRAHMEWTLAQKEVEDLSRRMKELERAHSQLVTSLESALEAQGRIERLRESDGQ